MARSINQEDIDKVTNMTTNAQRQAVASSYGKSTGQIWIEIPDIVRYEVGSVNGAPQIGRSEQNRWANGTLGQYWTLTYNYYSYDLTSYAVTQIHDALLTNPTPNSISRLRLERKDAYRVTLL